MIDIVNNQPRTAPRIAGLAAATCVAAATAVGLSGAAAATDEGMHGDPAAAAPFWRYQAGSEDCAEMAIADVVGQITGTEPIEAAVDDVGGKIPSVVHPGPIFRSGLPTDNADLPVLLKHYGITSTGTHTTMATLMETLDAGHKIIAAVNDHALRSEPGPSTQEDHFVVVTGIDTVDGIVHVNDSSSRSGSDEQVTLATFEKAWGTSSNFAVLTS